MKALRSIRTVVLLGAVSAGAPRSAAAAPEVTAIVGVTVVDPATADAGVPDQTVILRGDSIERVGAREATPVPPGAATIDGRGRWLVPGLVDAHVHFFQSGNPYTRPDVLDLRMWVPYAAEVARNTARLPVTFRLWLANGVTAVADVGGPRWIFDVRATAQRTPLAPRVAVSGPLISTVPRPELDIGDPPMIEVRTPEQAAALARDILRANPDFLKIWLIRRPGVELAADERLASAVAGVAHAAGKRLVVHATELATAKAALRAGADILAHSVSDAVVDGEFLDLARQRGALYIPTLFVMEAYDLALSGAWRPTPVEDRLGDPVIIEALRALERPGASRVARPSPVSAQNLRLVLDAGIEVAVGSDAGNIGTLHGAGFHREIEMLAAAGMSPQEILRAATVAGARMMGLADTIGAVRPGMLADLLLLDADPLASAANLSRVRSVIRAGRVLDPRELLPRAR